MKRLFPSIVLFCFCVLVFYSSTSLANRDNFWNTFKDKDIQIVGQQPAPTGNLIVVIGNNPPDTLTVNSVSKIDSVTYRLTTATAMIASAQYNIRILSVQDVAGNFAVDDSTFTAN